MIRFFVDFDGTVTTEDVVDLVLDRFAAAEWKSVEKEWAEGKIGSRECLSRQVALVRAGREDMEKLLSEVRIDPYFQEFLRTASAFAIPVAVVSDGFDKVIHEILRRSVAPLLLEKLPVFCNRLEWNGERPTALFAGDGTCAHGCANCKPAVIDSLRKPGDFVLFAGDGLSDRFAAETADLTFAKDKLLGFCRERGLRHTEYKNFNDLIRWMRSGDFSLVQAGHAARV